MKNSIERTSITKKSLAATECELMTAEFHANNIKAFNTLKEKHHVDIRVFPDDIPDSHF